MPFFELSLILRPMPRQEMVECLKRTARLIWKENGALRKIDYLGTKKLPYAAWGSEENSKIYEGSYFIYHLSLEQQRFKAIKPELKLDNDILISNLFFANETKVPEDYECTLEEELLPPSYRPSVQPLMGNKNVRADVRRAHNVNNQKVKLIEASVNSTKRAMSTLERAREQPPPGLLKVLERNPKRMERIKFLSELFKADGFELRIAGGAVRDIIRGKEPKDIDFATTAHPDKSLEIVKRHEDILRIIVTAAGQRHGTIAVKFKDAKIDFKRIKLSHRQESDQSGEKDAIIKGKEEPKYDDESPYEITTLRCDKLTDGRHAEVEFINDWQEDARRRDLTINAMFLSLDDGSLIDYFNGESDLKNGIVKFVGDADKRVKEDFLRILRFFRFWARYGQGKEPDESTLTVLRNNMDGLNKISGERIWQELKKILSYQPCHQVFELMLNLRVFDYVGLLDKDLGNYKEYSVRVLEEVKFVQENVKRYSEDILDPMRKANPKDPQVKKMDELIPVILFACAVQNDTLCLEAYKRVRFSNLERDLILYMIENKGKSVPINAYKYQLAISPAPERHVVMQRISAYLISRGDYDYIDRLRDWKVPKFPIPGAVIAKAVKERNLPSSKIKDIIEAIKLKWANSSYTSDKERLKQWIKLELDRLTEAPESSESNESDRLTETSSGDFSGIDWPSDTSESGRSNESSTN